VLSQVERVLVPLGLVLVFEPVVAVLAAVLLFQLVQSAVARSVSKGGRLV
jgi:hypothetical protein